MEAVARMAPKKKRKEKIYKKEPVLVLLKDWKKDKKNWWNPGSVSINFSACTPCQGHSDTLAGHHQDMPHKSVKRQEAGVQLMNLLHTNDKSLQEQYKKRWLAMPRRFGSP